VKQVSGATIVEVNIVSGSAPLDACLLGKAGEVLPNLLAQ